MATREAREVKKLELEDAREAREMRRLELEERQWEAKLALQRFLFVQAGMEKGLSKEDVEAFIDIALPQKIP